MTDREPPRLTTDMKLRDAIAEMFRAGLEEMTFDFKLENGMQVGFHLELIRMVAPDGTVLKDEMANAKFSIDA